MKNKLIAIFLFLLLLGCSNVKEKHLLVVKQLGPMYRIQFNDITDSSENMYSFYKRAKTLTDADKVKVINELLELEGDTRVIFGQIVNYNKNLSQFYEGKTERPTIEVQALFLINQVYFDNPFYYSPLAVLIDVESKEEINEDPIKMKEVFSAYKQWFNLVSKRGFSEAKKAKIMPLDYSSSKFEWIYGVDVDPDSPLQFDINSPLDKFH